MWLRPRRIRGPAKLDEERITPERICTSTGDGTLAVLDETPFATEDELAERVDCEQVRPGAARR